MNCAKVIQAADLFGCLGTSARSELRLVVPWISGMWVPPLPQAGEYHHPRCIYFVFYKWFIMGNYSNYAIRYKTTSLLKARGDVHI